MMNLFQLSSIIVILTLELPSSSKASNNSQQLLPNETSPATVTWIRITTLDPKWRDGRCKNCTNFDYDDPDDRLRRRRKRRRNKKPSGQSPWSDRRASEHPRKKYSTRVHLDKPTKFLQELPLAPTVPPPVRYLLPPLATSDLQLATSEAGRGSTKFRDTLADHENELDSFSSPPPATEPGRAAKSRLRPIVVPPVPNATDEPINRGSLSLEVAKAMTTPTYQQIQPDESMVTQNEGFVEHTRPAWQTTESFLSINSQNIESALHSKNQETPSRPTAGDSPQQPHRFVSGQIREFVPSSTAARNEYSSRYSENYSSRTAATVAYDVTSYSPPSNSSGEDSFNGLELAESSYFSELPSQREAMKLTQTDVIPGVAGKDYPVYSQTALLRKRKYACRGLEGYFADISSRCQVFYICNGNGAGEPMLCPNGTLFSQELLVCDWWYNVDC